MFIEKADKDMRKTLTFIGVIFSVKSLSDFSSYSELNFYNRYL